MQAKAEDGPSFCLFLVSFMGLSQMISSKGKKEELMEKKRKVLIGYENEFQFILNVLMDSNTTENSIF